MTFDQDNCSSLSVNLRAHPFVTLLKTPLLNISIVIIAIVMTKKNIHGGLTVR